MDFKKLKLTNSHVCDCMNECFDTDNEVFIRRIGAKKLKAGDFKVKIEREDTVDGDTCDEFCSQREISVNNISKYSKDEIIESYKIELMKHKKYAPNIDFSYCKFCFYSESGRIKHTPHHGHKSHYDFYKSDEFDISMLKLIGEPIRISFANTLVQEPPK